MLRRLIIVVSTVLSLLCATVGGPAHSWQRFHVTAHNASISKGVDVAAAQGNVPAILRQESQAKNYIRNPSVEANRKGWDSFTFGDNLVVRYGRDDTVGFDGTSS